MRIDSQEQLLDVLKSVRENVQLTLQQHRDPGRGICALITLCVGMSNDSRECLLIDLFAKWPKFSGNSKFPVPSTDPAFSPKELFFKHSFARAMWGGEYGALRMELLEWLIAHLENVDE